MNLEDMIYQTLMGLGIGVFMGLQDSKKIYFKRELSRYLNEKTSEKRQSATLDQFLRITGYIDTLKEIVPSVTYGGGVSAINSFLNGNWKEFPISFGILGIATYFSIKVGQYWGYKDGFADAKLTEEERDLLSLNMESVKQSMIDNNDDLFRKSLARIANLIARKKDLKIYQVIEKEFDEALVYATDFSMTRDFLKQSDSEAREHYLDYSPQTALSREGYVFVVQEKKLYEVLFTHMSSEGKIGAHNVKINKDISVKPKELRWDGTVDGLMRTIQSYDSDKTRLLMKLPGGMPYNEMIRAVTSVYSDFIAQNIDKGFTSRENN